jgi:hypothetical protein
MVVRVTLTSRGPKVKQSGSRTPRHNPKGQGKPAPVLIAESPTTKQGLNFAVIRDELDSLLASTANKIHREWPAVLSNVSGAREFLLTTVKMADNSYRTIRYICADIPKDPDRKLSYAISVPPLNRTILDSVFTVVFMLEELPSRSRWYLKAGWRALREELSRYKEQYEDSPQWQTWLANLEKLVQDGISIYGITPQEIADPKRIKRWPNPGRMPQYGVKSGTSLPPTRQFLVFLNDWCYRELSSQAHLSFDGVLRVGALLLRDTLLHDQKDHLEETGLPRFKSSQIGRTLTLVLALLSEIEAYFSFGSRQKLRYLWTILGSYCLESKEVYEKRYQALLS